MLIGVVHFNTVMYGFQEDLYENQQSSIDHPDGQEIEAETILAMTPLKGLFPAQPGACFCGCGTNGTM